MLTIGGRDARGSRFWKAVAPVGWGKNKVLWPRDWVCRNCVAYGAVSVGWVYAQFFGHHTDKLYAQAGSYGWDPFHNKQRIASAQSTNARHSRLFLDLARTWPRLRRDQKVPFEIEQITRRRRAHVAGTFWEWRWFHICAWSVICAARSIAQGSEHGGHGSSYKVGAVQFRESIVQTFSNWGQ